MLRRWGRSAAVKDSSLAFAKRAKNQPPALMQQAQAATKSIAQEVSTVGRGLWATKPRGQKARPAPDVFPLESTDRGSISNRRTQPNSGVNKAFI